MNPLACILAAPDLALEPALVAQSSALGLHIVRRSLDAADLMAAAALSPQLSIVLTPALPRLTRDLLARMCVDRLVIGLAHDDLSAQKLQALGVAETVHARSVEQTLTDLCAALQGMPTIHPRAQQQGVWSTGVWAAQPPVTPAATQSEAPVQLPPQSRGTVISVWGAPGSPGRSSAVLMLGQLIAGRTTSVCLVDADTSAPSLLQLLGIAENASSLVVACRFAERDSLSTTRLDQTVCPVDESLAVLGGIGHPEQWGDVRAPALASVLESCRDSFDLTVVDIGHGLASESPADFLTTQRFEAANAALAASDAAVVVAQATPLGISRFLQHLPSVLAWSPPNTAVAVTPPAAKGSARVGAATLRDYGLQLPIFEMPRFTSEELSRDRMRAFMNRRRWGRGSDLKALESWITASVADAVRTYGDGSTTTRVPTRANL